MGKTYQSIVINAPIGRVRLLPVTISDTTFVEWTSTWEAEDNKAYDFCKEIYAALLNDLQHTLS